LKTRFTIGLILLLGVSTGFAQVDDLPVRLAGVIYTDDSTRNTPFVHIINLRTGMGVISDSIGYFKINLRRTDTLLLRCIGFEDKFFNLSDTLTSTVLFVEIRLSETSYLLDVVDIMALSRLNQFKYDFANMPFEENEWENQMIIPGVSKANYKWIRDEEKALGFQPLWTPNSGNLFNKKDKNARTLIELINNEEGTQIIDEKFNMKLLGEFTGFSGDTLIDFKLFLNYSRSYLLSKSGYDIFLDVQNKLPEFKKIYFKEE
jgi:hypothetical protein